VALRDALVKARLARPFRWSADFVVWPTSSDASTFVTHASWLFQLRYDALTGTSNEALMSRITESSRI